MATALATYGVCQTGCNAAYAACCLNGGAVTMRLPFHAPANRTRTHASRCHDSESGSKKVKHRWVGEDLAHTSVVLSPGLTSESGPSLPLVPPSSLLSPRTLSPPRPPPSLTVPQTPSWPAPFLALSPSKSKREKQKLSGPPAETYTLSCWKDECKRHPRKG